MLHHAIRFAIRTAVARSANRHRRHRSAAADDRAGAAQPDRADLPRRDTAGPFCAVHATSSAILYLLSALRCSRRVGSRAARRRSSAGRAIAGHRSRTGGQATASDSAAGCASLCRAATRSTRPGLSIRLAMRRRAARLTPGSFICLALSRRLLSPRRQPWRSPQPSRMALPAPYVRQQAHHPKDVDSASPMSCVLSMPIHMLYPPEAAMRIINE